VRTDYFDEKVPGLALRVTENGHRSWCYLFTSPRNGKRARSTLGSYPSTSLAAARGKAVEAKGQVEAGQDPRDVAIAQEAGAMTVAGLIPSYLEKPHRRTGKPRKSVKEIERRLNRNVVPLNGDVRLADLHKRDVNRFIAPIMKRKRPIEAARVFEDFRAMVRWAVKQGYLDHNPLEGMEAPAVSVEGDRVLTDDEIRTLWQVLPDALARSVQCQHILKLCLVTAQRVGEVAGITTAELDLKAREWRLPGERTKNGRPHVVPLSDLAIGIIKDAMADNEPEANEDSGSKPLFACGDGSLSPVAVARTVLRAHEKSQERPLGRFGVAPWSTHDLRRTAVSEMAKLGVAPIVLGHIINHISVTKAGVTLKVYSHYSYDKEKRAALDLWAERLGSITAGTTAKVISLASEGVGQ